MYDLDIEQFWKDDEIAHLENCFNEDSPQVALGIRMSNECVFAELGEEGNPWGETPRERRIELNKRYNDKSEKIVGRRLLREDFPPSEAQLPAFKQIGEVFGGKYEFNGHAVWLSSHCKTTTQLEKIIDNAEKLNLRDFILPTNWESEKKRIFEQFGIRPNLFTNVRGPVTLATSIFGVENLIYLLYDEPEIAERFRDVICKTILEYHKIFVEEAGYTEDNFPHGFFFADDDCCLLTPDLYETFGYPVLKSVFEHTSPNPNDSRFQHSDSAMAHLLPILARLNLTGCNFGPTVTVNEIRNHMPHTRIDGQLAPFTFMRNNEEEIIAEVKRDCELIRESGSKGLNVFTAGSINNGSLLTSMRAVMFAIQKYGRY